MTVTHEKPVAVIDSNSGKVVAHTDKPFILALAQGEDLFKSILRCANDAQLHSASLSGLGGLCEITVAYFNHHTKQYQTKLFSDMHELISINGNIAFSEGQRFLHVHAALGDENYQVIGGHIMSATVNPSAEISIIPLTGTINRQFDQHTGLKLMCPIGVNNVSQRN